MNMKKRIMSSCIGIFLLMQMSTVSAVLLYDNGDSAWSGATTISWGGVGSDDFILTQDASLAGVSVDIWVSSSYDISNFEGMNWWVFDNNNGDPGNIINSGSSQNSMLTFVDIHHSGNVEFWKLFFEFGKDIPLQKENTYWLALRTINHSDPISWSNSPVIGFDDAYSADGTFDNWEHTSNPAVDHAFSLYGNPVPAPPAILFFSTGLVWLFGVKTRKYS